MKRLQNAFTLFVGALALQNCSTHALSSPVRSKQSTKTAFASVIANDVILYDGVCNFCNTWVDILLRIDTAKKFKFAPLQSSVGKKLLLSIGKDEDDISSVILVKTTGDSFDKSRCVLKVVEELGPAAKLASLAALAVVPDGVRDGIYDTVAKNRYNLMGKRDECRCSDPEFADRFLLD
jgi:predicted DCC family thiol-disulfide oxidoreductase YuxK